MFFSRTAIQAASGYVFTVPFDPFVTSVGFLLNGEVVPNTTSTYSSNYLTYVGGVAHDESPNPSDIPLGANADEWMGSKSPFAFGGGSVNMYAGSFAYLGISGTGNRSWFGTGDYGFEAFVMFSALGAQIILSTGTGGATGINFYLDSSAHFNWQRYDGASLTTATNVTVVTNQWYHVAVAQVGSSLSMFVNGIKTTGTALTGLPSAVQPLSIGTGTGSNATFTGWIGPTRITAGSAVYSPSATSITVPTSRLSSVTGATWVMNWDTAQTPDLTRNAIIGCYGSITASTTQKKTGSAALSFDGTSKYLKINSSQIKPFGLGDFTIDFWMYSTNLSGYVFDMSLTDNDSGSYPMIAMGANGGIGQTMRWYVGTGTPIVTGTPIETGDLGANNVWNHIAICRSNGVTRIYQNGVQTGNTYTDTNNYVTQPSVYVGKESSTNSADFSGYLDDFRITYAARYPGGTSFTPPTFQAYVPTTALGYSELYLDFETGAAVDTGFRSGTTAALTLNANSVTFGSGSGLGTPSRASGIANFGSSYISQSAAVNSNLFIPYQLDFTMEAWVYVPSAPTTEYSIIMLSKGTADSYASDHTLNFIITSGRLPALKYSTGAASASTVTGTTAITLSTWTHIAVTYNALSKMAVFYVGGQLAGTSSMSTYAPPLSSQGFINQRVTVGRQDPIVTTAQTFPGSMDNVRVAKGVQLYKAAFTPV